MKARLAISSFRVAITLNFVRYVGMTFSWLLRELVTIERPDTKWEQDLTFHVLELLSTLNFVRCVDMSHMDYTNDIIIWYMSYDLVTI